MVTSLQGVGRYERCVWRGEMNHASVFSQRFSNDPSNSARRVRDCCGAHSRKGFAHSRTTIDEPAKLDLPLADQSCAAFEAWFLDPTCRQLHVKKVARTKHQLAHN